MDYITIPGRPAQGSRLETDQGFFEYDGKRWNKFGEHNHDHLLKRGLAPETGDANHDFAEDMTAAYADGPAMHVGISTGLPRLPETRVVRYLIEESTLEEWLQHFLSKQTDYGDRANDLGLAGQYAEMSRKYIKLRRAMWEGHELTQESLREVLMDLVGHVFLSLMYVDHPGLTVHQKGSNT